MRNSDRVLAVERARLLIGCYRKSDAADPEVYARAVVAVLARHPDEVVIAVTEPATGLPSKLKWLPSIAEIVDGCDEAAAPLLRDLERRRIREQQQRLRLEAPPPGPKMTLSEIEAKLGRTLGAGLKKVPPAPVVRQDSNHAKRALADLASKAGRTE